MALERDCTARTRVGRATADGLVGFADGGVAEPMHAAVMNPRTLERIALASLIALIAQIGISLAFAVMAEPGAPRGLALASVEAIVLAFLLTRIARLDTYAMQWSSMLILLFMAEGVVRAMTERQPSSMLGAIEAASAAIYFVAVLAYLRPLKKAARESKR